mgnify:CR=1 FL=1
MFDDKNLKCKKVITRLMELAMPVIAEFSPLDLCDMIMFAENVAQNDEYAYKFAKERLTSEEIKKAISDVK